MFVAVVCLVPAVVVLYRLLESQHGFSALVGCTSLMLALTIMGTLVLIGGRLVYPVFRIALSADTIALMVSLLFGGLHSVLLLIGLALIVLAFAMRRSELGSWIMTATYCAGALQILGSYPWLTPSWWNATAATALAAWMLMFGIRLVVAASRQAANSTRPDRSSPVERLRRTPGDSGV